MRMSRRRGGILIDVVIIIVSGIQGREAEKEKEKRTGHDRHYSWIDAFEGWRYIPIFASSIGGMDI